MVPFIFFWYLCVCFFVSVYMFSFWCVCSDLFYSVLFLIVLLCVFDARVGKRCGWEGNMVVFYTSFLCIYSYSCSYLYFYFLFLVIFWKWRKWWENGGTQVENFWEMRGCRVVGENRLGCKGASLCKRPRETELAFLLASFWFKKFNNKVWSKETTW